MTSQTPPDHALPPRVISSWPMRLALIALTGIMLLIQGFHPLAEDGGLYVAGIEYRLNPTLFPQYTAFVTAHLRYSVFAPLLAGAVHLTHLPLAWILLLSYIFSLWLTLYAGLQLLCRCTLHPRVQLAGATLLAVWATLPVAGTSLLLVDPYLTARSFTTPLSLLAIAFALDDWALATPAGRRAFILCTLTLVAAISLHPLMAASVLAMIFFLRIARKPRPVPWFLGAGIGVVLAFAVLHAITPADSPAVIAASLSRYYWFLSQWEWFELLGLAGPFAMLGLVLRFGDLAAPARRLCHASLAAGSIAIVVALLFAHANGPSYLIARLQPLRIFLLIYAIMTLLLGATLAERIRKPLLLFPLFAISAMALFAAQRSTFPQSRHIELPWLPSTNPWSQAFIWARDATPPNALFALDTDYITTNGEDAQTFRATALRSLLPDFSKDGGEASITPSLAEPWQRALAAQGAIQSGTKLITHASLSIQSDAERDKHLSPLGVTWIILHADSPTSHRCPYSNATVKVCQLAP